MSVCTMPEMTVTGPFNYCSDPECPAHGRPTVDDRKTAHDGVRALLRLMGDDPDREGLKDTPARVVKAYLEMAAKPGDPATA